MNLAEAQAMAEEAKKRLGNESGRVAVSDPVSLRQIKEFMAAMDDWDPLYFDEEAARQGPLGRIAAPAMFFSAPLRKIVPESELWEDGQHKATAAPGIRGRSLAGGTEVELHGPVHVGDVITSRVRTGDVYAKEGKIGAMVFQVRETTYTNQHDDLLAVERTTTIFR